MENFVENELPFITKRLFCAALILMTSYALVSGFFLRGGDALNGKIDHGHYYLSKGAGEVSRAVFIYSAIHGGLMAGAFVLSAIGYYLVMVQTQDLRWVDKK